MPHQKTLNKFKINVFSHNEPMNLFVKKLWFENIWYRDYAHRRYSERWRLNFYWKFLD